MTHPSFKRDLFILTLLCVALLCFQLGVLYYMNPDESRYVDAAREMLATGQWITPTLNGTTFLDKPALFYWIEIIIMKTLGLHPWSVRLLPVGFATFACVMNYIAGRLLYDRKTAWLAALVLLTSTLFFIAAHYTNMDLMVASLIDASLWFFLFWLEKKRSGFLYASYLFAGLAFLTKGMIAIAFPALIIGCFILIYRRWVLLKKMHILLGILIILALNLPWYGMVQHRNPEFAYYFFYVQQFLRFSGNHSFNMRNPAYYYIMIIVAGMLPWSLFLVQSLWQKATEKETFILLWIGVITLFFSIPASKTPGYILPVFPPIAFMIGRYIALYWQTPRQFKEIKIIAIVYALLFIGASFFIKTDLKLTAHIPATALWPSLLIINVSWIILLAIAFKWSRKSVSQAFFIAFFILQSAFLMSLIKPIESDRNQKSIEPIAQIINQNGNPNETIIEYQRYDYDLLLYTQHDVKVVYPWNDPHIWNEDSWRRELMEDVYYKHTPRQPNLVLPEALPALWKTASAPVFLVASPHDLPQLHSILGPFKILYQNQNQVLLGR
ncbi:MAG: glycosyltransferase family 39 protein [Gammaproteobacteria bacterium]|nr:glycosyltransferase family 39 protein [Gammaproteobacteria bacterium]